ncbi:DUF3592 domain-containing protein [Microbispora sp. NBC_01189]|uniref:DUF3592 domain-containing protein n=1 Tax=unclassified Microbispora TaxID=2614687 RepID=UPI002E15DD96|nr:DUF3592 domain-containing protein [Microbispora sp. NBC_01189]
MSNSVSIALVFFGVGAGFALPGAVLVLDARRFRRRGARARGQVVRLRIRRSGRTTVYYSTVRFTTACGRQVEAEARFGGNPPPGRPGAFVPVVYDPARPARVRLGGAAHDGTMHGGICLAIGVLAVALGTADVLTHLL